MTLREKRRVVHLTTVHPRTDNRIFLKECSVLRDHFGDVHLVVADGKGGAMIDDVEIHDLGSVSGRFRRMLILPVRAFSRVRLLKPEIIHFHDPELLPVGLLFRWFGYRVIYDSHEDLPRAILSKNWIKPSLQRFVSPIAEIVENFCAKRHSAIVAATPHITKRFEKIHSKTVCVTNYPRFDNKNSVKPSRDPQDRTFVYIGVISRKRSAKEMVAATGLARVKLILAGPMEHDELASELAAMPEWKNVEYLGTLPYDGIWNQMVRALAGLLLFHPEPNHINSVPNKMFEYMAGGLPILCSDFDDWRKIVVDGDIGLTCDPKDPHAIAALMRRIIDDPEAAEEMGRRGREAVLTKYRWDTEAAKLIALYNRLLAE
jgi:glycosyltransferase involved in cell wall biosynthesis